MAFNGRTKIDWADFTWNPVWGCRNSCPYCYARKTAKRYGLQVAGRDDFAPTWIERNFNRPMPKRPSRIFVNSMSDVAHWEPIWQGRVMHRIAEHPEHTFLILTKEPEHVPDAWWAVENILCGVTVTDQRSYDRLVSRTPPRNFLSVEPLLGPVKPWGIHKWIIVGAESGNRRERVVPEVEWVEDIHAYARKYGIPLFFKESLRALLMRSNPEGADFPQEYPA